MSPSVRRISVRYLPNGLVLYEPLTITRTGPPGAMTGDDGPTVTMTPWADRLQVPAVVDGPAEQGDDAVA